VCGAGVDDGCDDVNGCGNPAGALVALVTERMADMASEAPEAHAEPLPIRTPGLAMAEVGMPASDVYTGPVDLPPFVFTPDMSSVDVPDSDALRGRVSDPLLTLIDHAEAADMGIRVARRARIADAAVSRFRRRVWTVAVVLATVSVPLILWAGGVW
jgi:hypothetical protein